MRVLVVGGDGVIGKAISDYWNNYLTVDCHYSTRHKACSSDKRPYIDLEKTYTFKLPEFVS